ncbi:MAG: hypothetical protein NVSMB64_07840 [Candidatus Velthaea sp.]
MHFGVVIDYSHCHLISIGADTVIAPRVHVLAHDASMKRHLDYTFVARTTIGKRVFVGAGSIILPGTTIGDNVIVGAGSVVRDDIAPGLVVAGNPARVLSTTAGFLQACESNHLSNPELYIF